MRVRVTVGVPPAIWRYSTGRCRVNRALFGDIGAPPIPPLRRSKAQHGGEHRAACVPVAAARHVNFQHDRTRRQARPTVADRTRVDHGRDFVCVCKHGAVLLGVGSVDGKEVAEHGWCCRKCCAVLWEENAVAVQGGGGRGGGGTHPKDESERDRDEKWCSQPREAIHRSGDGEGYGTSGDDQGLAAIHCEGRIALEKRDWRGRGLYGDECGIAKEARCSTSQL